MFYSKSSLLLIVFLCFVYVESQTYHKGEVCGAGHSCPLDCVTYPGQFYCVCRQAHIAPGPGLTWKENFTDCTNDYSPYGIHPYESGAVVGFPFFDYERLPNEMFTSNNVYQDFLPRNARLNANENNKGSWCAPGDSTESWLMVDLGNVSTISAVGSQGRAGVSVVFAAKTYKLQWSTDNVTWHYLEDSGSPNIFPGNEDGDTIVYNFIVPHLKARYLKFIPIEYNNLKCMRVGVLGWKNVNECENGWNRCDPLAKCTDTVDSYYCTCPVGYHDALYNGFFCVQINECIERRPSYKHNCSHLATCTDYDGGFNCDCNPGFRGDGYYCEDAIECEMTPPANPGYWCKPLADCINTFGSYECRCKLGYDGNPDDCQDVNECKKINNCSPEAKCENTIGSYVCNCRTGYAGSGFYCSDIDECENDPCHEQAVCGNTPGSYSCICKTGFRGSGRWCEDINECAESNNCKTGERCVNYDGGYNCICPKIMPAQRPYLGTERDILDKVIMNLRNGSSEDWRHPLDYHAHIVRTIYQLVNRTYTYHFKEVTHSFFYTFTAGNHTSIELYDIRCSDLANVSFPNMCHNMYEKTVFKQFTDVVDMWLIEKAEEPFENWATPPPPTPPQAEEADPTSTSTTTTSTPIPTGIWNINGTNVTYDITTTLPPPYRQCGGYFNDTNGGTIVSPGYFTQRKYPANAYCVWILEAPEDHSVYVKFEHFEMEESKKCFYDNVEIRDESETGEFKARYCGDGVVYKPAVRSGRRKLAIIFFSDMQTEKRGFRAIWRTLKPRVSLACVTYNQMSTMPHAKAIKWQEEIEEEKDKSQYVPISRLLACKQYPKCNHERPGDVIFTFEHIRTDRNVKKCVHWMLEKIGTSYAERPCDIIKTNKTHTICSCYSWGIVAVLGKFARWSPDAVTTLFELGANSFLSVLFVILALLFTLVFLFLKDQWGAVIMEVFTMKEYDSGRIIQMHIVFNNLLTEICFSIITFNVTPGPISCFVLAFLFYYLLQTVFFWLFIYTLFLQARVSEIFDSEKYNSYKLYMFVGYGLPFFVTLTLSGLNFTTDVEEKVCWLLFSGSTVWGFSGVIVTLGVGSLTILLMTIYQARNMENGILLQEKCIRTLFTQFFVLLTSVFGAIALQDRSFLAEYCFSLCNLLQGFSIAIMYCVLRREDPIIKANQIGPLPDWGQGNDQKFEDYRAEFKDMGSDAESSEDEDEEKDNEGVNEEENEEQNGDEKEQPKKKKYKHVRDGSVIFLQLRDPDADEDEGDDYERPYETQPIFSTAPKKEEQNIPTQPTIIEESSDAPTMNRFFVNQGFSDDESDQEIDFRFDEIGQS
ncbi:adhesion G protein-coupled receptor E2-like [Clytia hemisphaerica]|uniref:Uncharacterized protein n=1 Tax=Clytia hemisphaerica TaxID=252671 RepID=A0A7M5WSQ4_9CNID